MDVVFGVNNFRNEIVWKRATSAQKGSQHASKKWGPNTDTILFYGKTEQSELRDYRDLREEEIIKKFPREDEKGRRYYNDSAHIWSSPNMGARPNLCYTWRGFTNPHPSGWRLSKERMEEEYKKGNIIIRKDRKGNHKLERRKYLDDYAGVPIGSLWADILPASGGERTGYRTQKPLALLERIIKASSQKGETVLDAFCGCATTCVAAESLGRQWIGIDVSKAAYELVKVRLKKQQEALNGDFFKHHIILRTDIPKRTDLGDTVKPQHAKKALYGRQMGYCGGCRRHFEIQNLEVDHVVPKAEGGTDHVENYQLLCGRCNRVKGKRTMGYLLSQLKEDGTLIESAE